MDSRIEEYIKSLEARASIKDVVEETQPAPAQIFSKGQKCLHFDDNIDLITFFDKNINSGSVTLHPWQVEIGELLCKSKATDQEPFKFALCAANGSGKDAFVIAPFALWFVTTKIKSRVIITSSSGTQLTNQTEKYIRELGTAINAWFNDFLGEDNILDITQRKIECSLTGSLIQLFATDEEAKAEGYHPLAPGAEFAIIVNEAKSVTTEIFRALRRCTGFNYWVDVSSPGEPYGDFYKHFCRWPNKRRVTFFDCPHLSRKEFEEDKADLGEHSYYFRSKWLALFTTIGGNVVIAQQAMDRYKRMLDAGVIGEKFTSWPLRFGIDLAAGGDESVVSVFQGNKQIAIHASREVDTTKTADWIAEILSGYGIPKNHDYIFADDGGIGRAIIDMLQRKGWSIRRVLNNSVAFRKSEYRNRGAELWFKFARMVEECAIILLPDAKQYEQLETRRYKKSDINDKPGLEKKAEAKADGLASPDRADAAVLAFTDVALSDILGEETKTAEGPQRKAVYSLEEYEEMLFSSQELDDTNSEPIYCSLNALIKERNKRKSPFLEYVKN